MNSWCLLLYHLLQSTDTMYWNCLCENYSMWYYSRDEIHSCDNSMSKRKEVSCGSITLYIQEEENKRIIKKLIQINPKQPKYIYIYIHIYIYINVYIYVWTRIYIHEQNVSTYKLYIYKFFYFCFYFIYIFFSYDKILFRTM